MEELVKAALSHYAEYKAEAELYDKWLSNRENPDIRDALIILQLKLAAIQSWFDLLNADELLVVQKHIIEELEWPRVAFEFSERWKNVFIRSERSLGKFQASALRKITAFCNAHREITLSLFSDLIEPNEEH